MLAVLGQARAEAPAAPAVSDPAGSAGIPTMCEDLRASIKKYGWKLEPCHDVQWIVGGRSVQQRPLVYAEFGNPKAENTTLIFSSVHGDEVTPIYLGFQIVNWLRDHAEVMKKSRVIIAPLVNPDGFFSRPPTRVNARGVDVNRNFMTHDWKAKAIVAWKSKYRSDPRRFPGSTPSSEPETIFQQELIKKYAPQKILTVHSPLNHMDYDGPSAIALAKFPREYVKECVKLRQKLKAVSAGFYPGSLGNYAGQELGIPTITLELPTANPAKAEAYWQKFQEGIRTMIEFEVPAAVAARELPPGDAVGTSSSAPVRSLSGS